jgi:hypothetical protein
MPAWPPRILLLDTVNHKHTEHAPDMHNSDDWRPRADALNMQLTLRVIQLCLCSALLAAASQLCKPAATRE